MIFYMEFDGKRQGFMCALILGYTNKRAQIEHGKQVL